MKLLINKKSTKYSGDQPYIDSDDYIKKYIRDYYDLPKDFEINYE